MRISMKLFMIIWVALLALVSQGARAQQCQNHTTGLVPITDLGTNLFNGMQGGLYGGGRNAMPQTHMEAGIRLATEVIPRDANGNPSPSGKIGFISMGMSNANMFFAGLRDSALA
jgi:hypothetical protein